MQEKSVLLRVENLKVYYELKKFGLIHVGYVKAVEGVSFTLNKGEALSIVGESGCGKTTLAKTILGLIRPFAGKVVFDGKDITQLDRKARLWYSSQVGFVQQDPYGALPPFMTVKRILQEPMLIHGIRDPKEQMARMTKILTELKMTPVEDFLGKFPHMLSGGQQQRVVIARATILNPKLIVADEPVSMLDASVRVEILQLLRQLQKEHGIALIYITHDLSTVSYFSERIIVMYAGWVVEEAPTQKLLDNPLHPYTKALLEAISDPTAENLKTFKRVPPGEPPNLVNPPSGCRFHPRCEMRIDGLCDKEKPEYFWIDDQQRVLCWLYKR
ncbi:MAG: ABC transporter ATP-binding protein [Thermofilaceae archaeon]